MLGIVALAVEDQQDELWITAQDGQYLLGSNSQWIVFNVVAPLANKPGGIPA